MEITHFGSGILHPKSDNTVRHFPRNTTGNTIITPAWRGLALKHSELNRARSLREPDVETFIISIAQHARPKVAGQSDDLRAKLIKVVQPRRQHFRQVRTNNVFKTHETPLVMRPCGSFHVAASPCLPVAALRLLPPAAHYYPQSNAPFLTT